MSIKNNLQNKKRKFYVRKNTFQNPTLTKQGQKLSTRTYKSRLKLGQMVKKVNKSQTKSIHKIS